jgi:hypothetical protein
VLDRTRPRSALLHMSLRHPAMFWMSEPGAYASSHTETPAVVAASSSSWTSPSRPQAGAICAARVLATSAWMHPPVKASLCYAGSRSGCGRAILKAWRRVSMMRAEGQLGQAPATWLALSSSTWSIALVGLTIASSHYAEAVIYMQLSAFCMGIALKCPCLGRMPSPMRATIPGPSHAEGCGTRVAH